MSSHPPIQGRRCRKLVRTVTLRNRHYKLAVSLLEERADNQGLRTLDSAELAVAVDSGDSFVTADKVLVRPGGIENVKVLDPEVPNP